MAQSVLNETSKTTLGALIGVVGVAILATSWVWSTISNFEKSVTAVMTEMRASSAALTADLKSLREYVDAMTGDRYTRAEAALNAARAAIRNPGIYFPDPQRPGEFLRTTPAGEAAGGRPIDPRERSPP